MYLRVFLILLLLLASGLASAKPRIELAEAVRLAEAYVSDHKVSNDDRYLASVVWEEDFEHPERSCWTIFWAHNEPGMLDAQLVVWVFDDGRIKYQDSWA